MPSQTSVAEHNKGKPDSERIELDEDVYGESNWPGVVGNRNRWGSLLSLASGSLLMLWLSLGVGPFGPAPPLTYTHRH